MKQLFYLFACLLLISCSTDKIEKSKAMAAAENVLKSIDAEDYSKLNSFYTEDFNSGESMEARMEKFKKLRAAMGPLKSFELVKEDYQSNVGEQSQAVLTYKVLREKMNSIETFSIVEEDGKYKIGRHSIRSENL